MGTTVIYGSDGGTTQGVAKRIASPLQAKVVDIKVATTDDLEGCDLLILGAPTYGLGDLQCDWESRIGVLDSAKLTGKRVALFGTGDQIGYPDSFVDAMGILYDRVVALGATVVGFTATQGYDYSYSLAERDGQFVGLALDEDNQSSLTGKRIAAWVDHLK
ncbi:flavodoxin FldA [Rhodospirillum rubrum]|uniref:Flavodoxin n=1 Tax=Rhodospirillum rubrum (strain ATCC 11170 / ATH 1.1.1 / DSM 467 / LMG 4362 / NCIMB 8255 / S1) TaxID=269796 RepID=Q2RXG1_RHORT|nr:flavodoxin FldA [Rhodospirillum rubrum]ABC21184.1 Flavodoxin, long chain [Rhodospirillum rubrum ATCC 11170]AEO46858.1 flavodoxin FldA [Rhodospirillum rubrum F11]MBK5952732.1 flavodoxin [Rhodospirillum rubrum]QXG80875.1 flavodoxin FldA [Rhodospirillum rubrum]HAP99534.1 flavodoxin FldA [Rhodospirillum rubrum]